MEITEVRVKLMEEDSGERLKAFCSITFDDCFVIRDLKIIEGANGPFVAMPSRKLTAHCPQCGCKNHLRAVHCNQCGRRLADVNVVKDEDGRAKLYADIAHPINSTCREMIQQHVIDAFHSELNLAQQEGYISRYEDPDEPPQGGAIRRESEPAKPTPTPQRTQIQPPQAQPRGPHTDMTQQPRCTDRQASEADVSGFGDGVFEK